MPNRDVIVKYPDGVYCVGNIDVAATLNPSLDREENVLKAVLILQDCFSRTAVRVRIGNSMEEWMPPQPRLFMTLRALAEAINRTEENPRPHRDERLEQNTFNLFLSHFGIDTLDKMMGGKGCPPPLPFYFLET